MKSGMELIQILIVSLIFALSVSNASPIMPLNRISSSLLNSKLMKREIDDTIVHIYKNLASQDVSFAQTFMDGNYTFGNIIGKGYTGLVYKAIDNRTKNSFAIKLLSKGPTVSFSEVELLESKIMRLAKEKHIRIVNCVKSGSSYITINNTPFEFYYIMYSCSFSYNQIAWI